MAEIRILQLKVDDIEGNVVIKENDYKSSQELVGGYIECLAIDKDIDLWLNEEGKLNGLPFNFGLLQDGELVDVIVGDVFFSSHDRHGNTTSLNDKQIEKISNRFINRRNFRFE